MYIEQYYEALPQQLNYLKKIVIKKIINYKYVIITIKIKCYNKIGVKIGEILLHFTHKKYLC